MKSQTFREEGTESRGSLAKTAGLPMDEVSMCSRPFFVYSLIGGALQTFRIAAEQ